MRKNLRFLQIFTIFTSRITKFSMVQERKFYIDSRRPIPACTVILMQAGTGDGDRGVQASAGQSRHNGLANQFKSPLLSTLEAISNPTPRPPPPLLARPFPAALQRCSGLALSRSNLQVHSQEGWRGGGGRRRIGQQGDGMG